LEIVEIGQIALRLAHGLAAAIWVGGGAYYVLAVRPKVREASQQEIREFAGSVQREFGEWSTVATIVMIATGVVLMFERLSGGQGTTTWVLLLAVKVVAAIVAFWMSGVLRPARVMGRRRQRPDRFISSAWIVLWLSILAFLLGALLTTIYPALEQ
jgi:uncharacterized membrane protein